MAFRAIFGFLVPFLFGVNAWADDIRLNPDHPEQYIVVEGDTLWDISSRFLESPWQWPEIWENNSQINNPNLIYPGDVIVLKYVDGKPRLSLSDADIASRSGAEVVRPRIRSIPIKESIKSIPIGAISQFLTSPKVVTQNEIDQAPYVVDLADEHLLAGATGDRFYVRAIEEPETLGYTVYRRGDPYVNPITNELLGYEAEYVADCTLQNSGDPATLVIDRAASEIRIGDRLLPNPEGQINLNYFPHSPIDDVKGSIISVLGGVSQIGKYNVVVIDKGIADGLESGHVLEIIQRGAIVRDPYSPITNATVKLPDEPAGVLMVFRPFERVSYALIMESDKAIHIFDKIQTP
ncbi:MAG: LysM peptidoglycan-binding domain-containing protein [Gammaproteobacteria bacterium]